MELRCYVLNRPVVTFSTLSLMYVTPDRLIPSNTVAHNAGSCSAVRYNREFDITDSVMHEVSEVILYTRQ